MHIHEGLIHELYLAFSRKDGKAMGACYHPKAVFSDPVFPRLTGEQIGSMWTMLCLQASNLEIEVYNIKVEGATGQAVWEASYEFGKPPRPVHNIIHAEFEFFEGRIIKHGDQFNFWKWSRMALGPLGLLLGWQKGVQQKIQQQAYNNLKKFMSGIK